MSRRSSITVSSSAPLPKGYAFLPKGIPYKTLHCRRLTHEAGKPLYVVQDSKKKPLGIRIPKSIFFRVQAQAKETLADRRAATKKRDATLLNTAATELDQLFPKIPAGDREMVLRHGFRKHSGRVGRTGQLPMSKKVVLAVLAHTRHKHTKYNKLLEGDMDRAQARKAIQKTMESTVRKWGCKDDLSWYFHTKDRDLIEDDDDDDDYDDS